MFFTFNRIYIRTLLDQQHHYRNVTYMTSKHERSPAFVFTSIYIRTHIYQRTCYI